MILCLHDPIKWIYFPAWPQAGPSSMQEWGCSRWPSVPISKPGFPGSPHVKGQPGKILLQTEPQPTFHSTVACCQQGFFLPGAPWHNWTRQPCAKCKKKDALWSWNEWPQQVKKPVHCWDWCKAFYESLPQKDFTGVLGNEEPGDSVRIPELQVKCCLW